MSDSRLADYCSSIDYGYTAPACDDPAGPHFLRITDIVTGPPRWDQVPYCNADERKAEKFKLNDRDIVVARTGATTGVSAYIREPPPAVFASYLVRLTIDETVADARFASYYLKGPQFWGYMRGVLGDKSAQPNASAKTITQAPASFPPVDEQRAIAGVLGALDDKIEQNRRTTRVLERLARAIFRAWFVDFDPVKAKAAGAASFPSMPQPVFDALPTRFVDSEIGPVPEGWEVKAITKIATFLNGLALQKYPPRGDGEDLRVIKIAQLRRGSVEGAAWANSDLPERYVIRDRDLLFSWSGTLEVKFWFGGRGALNQHLFKVTSSRFPSWFCFLWILQHLPWFRAIAASKATTMGHIKRGHLEETSVVVPPNEVLQDANEVIGPIYDLFGQLMIESRNLAAIRDVLLPKLLSGELRVRVDGRVDSES